MTGRPEQVVQLHGHTPSRVDCPAIDDIIEEGDTVTGDIAD